MGLDAVSSSWIVTFGTRSECCQGEECVCKNRDEMKPREMRDEGAGEK